MTYGNVPPSISVTVTSPAPSTAKLFELNEANPVLDVEATAALIVKVLPDIAVTIPPPLAIVSVSPKETASLEASLPVIVIIEFASLPLLIDPASLPSAIAPANISFVIPPAVTCILSAPISIEASSTATANELPVFVIASPPVI